MEILRIEHPTGYLHISVERFFPCPVRKAQKVFTLACAYCEEEHLEELQETLRLRVEQMKAKEAELEDRRVLAASGSYEYRDTTIQINRIKRERAQLERNIRDLIMRRAKR